ncbi:DedA family protein [Sporomusa termitida]|uniref:SNARE associated Golgi protein n=1 Tax=Sporomusa termitida TaxID=2377 RepID=A0A517DPY7_9FIRM|nr:DedA family protein [Sporomusa termitida]QDR79424.1 SNARE associated Golgi protein [Sporomusa termitida]
MPIELTVPAVFNSIGDHSYAVLLGAMLLAGVGVPLPGELTLGFTGYLVYTGQVDLMPAIAATTAGDLLGAVFSYGVGYFARTRVVAQYLYFFLPAEAKLAKLTCWLNRYGIAALMIGRLLPVIRGGIPLTAGFVRMNARLYLTGSLISSAVWCSAIISLSLGLGHNWQQLSGLATNAGLAAAGLIIIIFAGGYMLRRL